MHGLADAQRAAGIVNVAVLDHARGRSGPITDFRDRLAYVIAASVDAAQAADAALELLHGDGCLEPQGAANG